MVDPLSVCSTQSGSALRDAGPGRIPGDTNGDRSQRPAPWHRGQCVASLEHGDRALCDGPARSSMRRNEAAQWPRGCRDDGRSPAPGKLLLRLQCTYDQLEASGEVAKQPALATGELDYQRRVSRLALRPLEEREGPREDLVEPRALRLPAAQRSEPRSPRERRPADHCRSERAPPWRDVCGRYHPARGDLREPCAKSSRGP
jgi:hypothetical protein